MCEARALPHGFNASLAQPFFYFHIPKTGGSTVLQGALEGALRGVPTVSFLGYTKDALVAPTEQRVFCERVPLNCTDGPVRNRIHRLSCALALVNHAPPVPLLQLLSAVDRGDYGPPACRRWDTPPTLKQLLKDGSLCVTLLRDPVTRAISDYDMYIHRIRDARSAAQFARQQGLAAFVNVTNGNAQLDYLGGERHARVVLDSCVVGVFEELTEFVGLLRRVLRLPTLRVPHLYSTVKSSPPDERANLTRSLHESGLLQHDQKLWKQAKCVWRAQKAQLLMM
jgi:hypothetical protein